MSTRSTKLILGPLHVFWDVVACGYYLDIGRHSYNRAYRLWPPPLGKRLY